MLPKIVSTANFQEDIIMKPASTITWKYKKKHAHESKKLALVGLLINSFMTEISSTVMKSGLIWIYI